MKRLSAGRLFPGQFTQGSRDGRFRRPWRKKYRHRLTSKADACAVIGGDFAAGKLFEARRFIRGDGPGACRLRQPDWPDARLSVAESLPRRYRGGCRESAPVRGERRGSATIRYMGPFAVERTCRTGAYRESMSIDAPIAEYLRENGAQACRCPDDAMPAPPSATGTNRERLSLCAFSLPAHGAANLKLYFGDSIGQCGI